MRCKLCSCMLPRGPTGPTSLFSGQPVSVCGLCRDRLFDASCAMREALIQTRKLAVASIGLSETVAYVELMVKIYEVAEAVLAAAEPAKE